MTEEVYTLTEIATMLKCSREHARQMFGHQAGVLDLNEKGKKSTSNGRVCLRVPASVYQRVINERQRM